MTSTFTKTHIRIPKDVEAEYIRQEESWGDTNEHIPDDRWIEIALDEFNDLRWAVRTCNPQPGHTIAKERAQLIAVLIRWHAKC